MLGGSFYPPHSGHIQISEEAIRKLNLNEVWWIIAQKHPDKVKTLAAKLTKWRTDTGARMPTKNEKFNSDKREGR